MRNRSSLFNDFLVSSPTKTKFLKEQNTKKIQQYKNKHITNFGLICKMHCLNTSTIEKQKPHVGFFQFFFVTCVMRSCKVAMRITFLFVSLWLSLSSSRNIVRSSIWVCSCANKLSLKSNNKIKYS